MTRILTNIKDIQAQKLETSGQFVDCNYVEPSSVIKRFIASMLLQADAFDKDSDWEVHTIMSLVEYNDIFLALVDVYSESEHKSQFVYCWWTSFLDFDFSIIASVETKDEAFMRCGFPEDIYNDPIPVFMTENEIRAWHAFALEGERLQIEHKKMAK
jgi:hypothetical protein